MDLFEQTIRRVALQKPRTSLEDAIFEADEAVWEAKKRGTYAPPITGVPTREELAEAIFQTPAVMIHLEGATSTHYKLLAIREARATFSVGLKEAKDAVELVEEWQAKGYNPPAITREDELKAIESVMDTMRKKEAPDGQI